MAETQERLIAWVLGELGEAGDNGEFRYFFRQKDVHKQYASMQVRKRQERGALIGSGSRGVPVGMQL
jgi:hypothetical protein